MRSKFILILSMVFIPFLTEIAEAQSFQTGKIAMTLASYCRVRVTKDSLTGLRQIDRSSYLAGVNPNYVFSYYLSAELEDSIRTVTNPSISDYELYGSINSTYDTTGGSPNFHVKHNVYGWTNTAYALVKLTTISRETAAQNTVLGMEIISQLDGSYGLELVYWMADKKILAQYRPPTSTYVGYKLLSAPTTTVRLIDWYDGYNYNNPDLYGWITAHQIDTLLESGGDGAVSFFSQDAVNIAPGDSAIVWVGISIGADETEMITNMDLAEARYNTLVDVAENTSPVPSEYSLLQNYPNPFNPSTAIQFSIPQSGFVSLNIYDVLGNEVAGLIHGELNAGTYTTNFNAGGLSSGIYFYKLSTGNYTETKKMNLLK